MEPISLQNSVSSIFKTSQQDTKISSTPFEGQQSFSSVLKKTIQEVNNAQVESATMTEKLVRGEDVNLDQVMIVAQQASITLQATMEVRNKVVEAYQEIMRMNV